MSALLPLAIAGLVAVMAYGSKRLDAAAQPLRLELAAEAGEFLANPDIEDVTRFYVKFLLDTAFGMRTTILMSFVAIPFFALGVLLLPRSMRKVTCIPADEILAARFYALQRLHDRITLANHPFLMAIFEAEMSIVRLAALTRAAFDGVIPNLSSGIVLAKVKSGTRRPHMPKKYGRAVPA